MYSILNTNEFGYILNDIANCLLSNYITTSNGKDMCVCVCVCVLNVILKMISICKIYCFSITNLNENIFV